MIIDIKEFKKALEAVKPGLASKESVEQATHFAFVGDKIYSYDDAVCITAHIEGMDINAAVLGKEIYSYVNKLSSKTKEVNVSLEESSLIIKAGRSKAGFAVEHEIRMPINNEELEEKSKWRKLPQDFVQAVTFVMDSASSDDTISATNCVHFKDGFVEATDRNRLSHWKLNGFKSPEVFLPLDAAKVLVKFKPTKMSSGKGWIHFKNADGFHLSCRLYIDIKKYQDTSVLVEEPEDDGFVWEIPAKLVDVIGRVETITERPDKLSEALTISIQPKKIVVTGQSEIGSWIRESIPYKHKGSPLEFSITPFLFRSLVRTGVEVQVHPKNIRAADGDWVHLAGLKI